MIAVAVLVIVVVVAAMRGANLDALVRSAVDAVRRAVTG